MLKERIARSLGFLPEECLPDLYVRRLISLDPTRLRDEYRLKGLVLDLDGTLTSFWDEAVFGPELIWLRRAEAAGLRLCIVSNVPRFYGAGIRRLESISQELGIPCIAARKPRLEGFNQALKCMGLPADSVAVIGDQMKHDIRMGRRGRARLTILVQPLEFWEFPGTMIINRNLERLLHWLLQPQLSIDPPPE